MAASRTCVAGAGGARGEGLEEGVGLTLINAQTFCGRRFFFVSFWIFLKMSGSRLSVCHRLC